MECSRRRRDEIIREVSADFEAELREFNGEHDHVHLLVHYPPKVCPASAPPGRSATRRRRRSTLTVGTWGLAATDVNNGTKFYLQFDRASSGTTAY